MLWDIVILRQSEILADIEESARLTYPKIVMYCNVFSRNFNATVADLYEGWFEGIEEFALKPLNFLKGR